MLKALINMLMLKGCMTPTQHNLMRERDSFLCSLLGASGIHSKRLLNDVLV